MLVIEEGQPDFIEQNLHAILRKAGMDTKVHGKDMLPMAGEYTAAGGHATASCKFVETAYAPTPDLPARDGRRRAPAPSLRS